LWWTLIIRLGNRLSRLVICVICSCSEIYLISKPFNVHSLSSHQFKSVHILFSLHSIQPIEWLHLLKILVICHEISVLLWILAYLQHYVFKAHRFQYLPCAKIEVAGVDPLFSDFTFESVDIKTLPFSVDILIILKDSIFRTFNFDLRVHLKIIH